MTEISFSSTLRQLSKNYYQQHIGFEDYRAQRKIILDQIDEEFNGRQVTQVEEQQADEKSSIFLKTIAFFQNTDLLDKDKSD